MSIRLADVTHLETMLEDTLETIEDIRHTIPPVRPEWSEVVAVGCLIAKALQSARELPRATTRGSKSS
jgi:hypothetical protein